MSRAFDAAFDIVKMNHFERQYGYEFVLDAISKAVQDPRVEKMRMFVLQNMDSPDPQMRAQAERIYAQLTQIMSGAGGKISAATPLGVDPSPPPNPAGLMSTANPQGEAPMMPSKPMAKALDAFFDAEFIRKNVIGIQEVGSKNTPVQYSMPPSVASMSQRPQVPEMMTQTMDVPTQAPGIFGRFKAPVMQQHTTQIPTGHTVTGGPQTMNVQQNPENPMAGIGAGYPNANEAGLGGQMMPPPGAAIERMPRPSPFDYGAPDTSFAGQGYTVNDAGNWVRPKNPYRNTVGTRGALAAQSFEDDLRKPVGNPDDFPYFSSNSQVAQMGAADQFTGLGY